jgi:hypothetical protein
LTTGNDLATIEKGKARGADAVPRKFKKGERLSKSHKQVFKDNADGSQTPMTITSKCPEKWLFVDMESGNVWRYNPTPATETDIARTFSWPTPIQLKELLYIAIQLVKGLANQ